MALAGHSLQTTPAQWAEVHGITTAAGNPVYQSTVWRVLRSPHLLGYRRYQAPAWKKNIDTVSSGPLAYVARGADGEPVVAHGPACHMMTFLRLQRALAERRTSNTRRPLGSHEWLLTGLLICCDCGDRLCGHQKLERSGSKGYRYMCMAKYPGGELRKAQRHRTAS